MVVVVLVVVGGGGCMTSTPWNLGAYSKSALHGGYGYFLSGSVLAQHVHCVHYPLIRSLLAQPVMGVEIFSSVAKSIYKVCPLWKRGNIPLKGNVINVLPFYCSFGYRFLCFLSVALPL